MPFYSSGHDQNRNFGYSVALLAAPVPSHWEFPSGSVSQSRARNQKGNRRGLGIGNIPFSLIKRELIFSLLFSLNSLDALPS